ncbi:MAG: maleylpyruvate isomerase family mycothiol-dependent enzyme [Acidimicrobiia bacterium]|nr:maleylpyruvate isomerase family mycothiol-dependent enzyme [Acidimicrobiia bacterium]
MSAPPVAASSTGPDLTAAFTECREAMSALGSSLDEEQWAHPSLCPGWTCKDALVHVTSAEVAFADWVPSPEPPMERIREVGRELSRQPGAEVLGAFEAVMARRLEQLANATEADLDRVGWSPAGVGPHRRYLEIRVFDHWAHEHDIRVPLGLGSRVEGRSARTSLDEAHIAFGYLVGKRAGAPDGSSVTVHVTGPLARDLHAVVEGRAKVVAELAGPTCEVTADFLTFMLLCCGRIDPEGPLQDGRVALSGDRALAEKVARNLAFTI